ncbi:hypothetical protein SeLEV6574_g04286, partial [Synchytrium endobioticum]
PVKCDCKTETRYEKPASIDFKNVQYEKEYKGFTGGYGVARRYYQEKYRRMEGGAKKASKGEWDMVINKMLEVVDCTTGRRVQDGRNVVVAFGTGEFESQKSRHTVFLKYFVNRVSSLGFRIVRVDVYFTSKNVQDLIPIDCSLPMAAHSPVIKDKLDASDPPKHHASTPNIEQVRSYLHHKCRVTISDGREFVGYFVCVDKQKNMILSATEEHIQGTTRHVGLVMIPGPHLRKWEVLHLADDDDDNDEPSSMISRKGTGAKFSPCGLVLFAQFEVYRFNEQCHSRFPIMPLLIHH